MGARNQVAGRIDCQRRTGKAHLAGVRDRDSRNRAAIGGIVNDHIPGTRLHALIEDQDEIGAYRNIGGIVGWGSAGQGRRRRVRHRRGAIPAEHIHKSDVGLRERVHHAWIAERQGGIIARAGGPIPEIAIRICVVIVQICGAVIDRKISLRTRESVNARRREVEQVHHVVAVWRSSDCAAKQEYPAHDFRNFMGNHPEKVVRAGRYAVAVIVIENPWRIAEPDITVKGVAWAGQSESF